MYTKLNGLNVLFLHNKSSHVRLILPKDLKANNANNDKWLQSTLVHYKENQDREETLDHS